MFSPNTQNNYDESNYFPIIIKTKIITVTLKSYDDMHGFLYIAKGIH